MKRPIFYGVSVGPGDPELMTIKAVKALEACNIIIAPRTHKGNTLALDIAKSIVDFSNKTIVFADFKMSKNDDENNKSHKVIANIIRGYLIAGDNVAMLSIGDISLYSTFSYILNMLKDEFECQIIAGVTSFSACAGTAKRSLTNMKEPLMIIPASFTDIDSVIKLNGTKVIMKSGKKLEEVITKLNSNNIDYVVVQDCGLESENIVYKNSGKLIDSYFTTILVRN